MNTTQVSYDQFTTTDWTTTASDWNQTANFVATTPTSYYYNYAPDTWSAVKQPKPPSRLKRFIDRLTDRLAEDHGALALPPIGGGSGEAETEITVEEKKLTKLEPGDGVTEHKKKVTIERKVGVRREKDGEDQELHKGSVELVRSIEGTDLQKATIGLKTNANGGGSYVEVTVDKLREALDILDPKDDAEGFETGRR